MTPRDIVFFSEASRCAAWWYPLADWRAAMTFKREADGFARTIATGSPWRNEISPRIFATVALHRPLARARGISCPLWVGVAEEDITTHSGSVIALAQRAPAGELQRYAGDHFDVLVGEGTARIAEDQTAFLARHVLAA